MASAIGPSHWKHRSLLPGCYRKPRHLGGMKPRSMQVELRGAETIGPALRTTNELGAQHIAVERVRALPVGDMHDAVVEGDG